MSSWTAEFTWIDPEVRNLVQGWTGNLDWNAMTVHVDEVSGRVTATVTIEAPSIADALPIARQIVDTVSSDASLQRISATGAYTRG